ncbi:prolyl aminopeptidase [Noviherbaspirillum sedimenti]|uniref:Proline iminopeptidase n=1 Tax=Noviherbaspirillum sedimenti TaxID=2320865 RepID=A0A3A3G6D7_9BURK|nr:prolyl aminopeptidase [Noviherbaspirillum sedimenti]RJG03225.1 prolyl aminopeptidase [Noviherbaspirillum sedimenti]
MPIQHPKPFHENFLPVVDGHAVYYAEYGQPRGNPVVVLHGGPGSGCSPTMLTWFDLAYDRVILFDQRGAGNSTPLGELGNNRTSDLVGDVERLRQHLGIARWRLVGGSWGATLALCYLGTHPKVVSGAVLRGVFLASEREIEWFFQTLQALAPQAWDQLTFGWTASQRSDVFHTLTAMFRSRTLKDCWDAAKRWGHYEESIMHAMAGRPLPPMGSAPERWLQKYRLQAHYLSNNCFVTERYLFRQARRAKDVPTIIVHGTHDWICPPMNVTRLARFLPRADVRWVEGGTHAASDPLIAAALRRAIADLR